MHAGTALSRSERRVEKTATFGQQRGTQELDRKRSRRIAGEPGSSKSWSARTTSEASLRFDGRTPKNSVSWSVINKALAAIPCALLPFFISSQSMCTRAPHGFKATSGPVSPRVAPLLRRLYWCNAFPWSHPAANSREMQGLMFNRLRSGVGVQYPSSSNSVPSVSR